MRKTCDYHSSPAVEAEEVRNGNLTYRMLRCSECGKERGMKLVRQRKCSKCQVSAINTGQGLREFSFDGTKTLVCRPCFSAVVRSGKVKIIATKGN